jgi:hypothetical protein
MLNSKVKSKTSINYNINNSNIILIVRNIDIKEKRFTIGEGFKEAVAVTFFHMHACF